MSRIVSGRTDQASRQILNSGEAASELKINERLQFRGPYLDHQEDDGNDKAGLEDHAGVRKDP